MPSHNELGRAIALLRGQRSQLEVARKGRISPVVWNLYENGHRKPTATSLVKILRGLSCSRLQLEEAQWQLLRQRLLAEETTAELEEYLTRRRTKVRFNPAEKEDEEALRRELRQLLAQIVPLIEEFVVLSAKARGG